MRCAYCAKPNPEGRGLCIACGEPLVLACQWCGSCNRPGESVCCGCKADLPAQESAVGGAPIAPQPDSFADGRYRVIRLLRESGARKVYLAEDSLLGRRVSILTVPESGRSDAARAHVMSQARTAARLSGHPRIAGIHEVREEQGLPYIVGEYLGEDTLEDLLRRSPGRRLPIADALAIAAEACDALAYAHSLGIVHGGLSPASIFLAPGGSSRVGDFGLGFSLAVSLSRISCESIALGSTAYVAPEQFRGRPAEPRSDLYALGAILYAMIAGRPPFAEGDADSRSIEAIPVKPPALSQLRPDIPASLQGIVSDLLRRRPEKRPEDAALVGRELRKIAERPNKPPLLARWIPAAVESAKHRRPEASLRRVRRSNAGRNRTAIRNAAPAFAAGALAAIAVLKVASIWSGRGADFSQMTLAQRVEQPLTLARSGPPILSAHGPSGAATAGMPTTGPIASKAAGAAGVPSVAAAPGTVATGSPGLDRAAASASPNEAAETSSGDLESPRYRQLLDLAQQGNPGAQAVLGNMFLRGDGIPRDYAQALQWLSKAASRGNSDAQTSLAYMYATGEGVSQNYSEAAQWFSRAAAKENSEAQYDLALMYDEGQGVPKDHDGAIKWLRRSAAQENVQAEYELGRRYLTAQGVEKDYARALQWLRKAADQGNDQAQNALGYIYEQGRGVLPSYTEALHWYRKAAEQGDAKAQLNLGIMYENGEGVAIDYAEAAQWYRKAAGQGDAYAQTSMGVMYCKAEGLPRDYSKALEWFLLAAGQGEPKAEYNLGIMYDTGMGVTKDYAEAARWYERAAAQGHVDAQYNLGYLYEHGQGVARNSAEALQWYRKAAGQGDSSAMERLLSLQSK